MREKEREIWEVSCFYCNDPVFTDHCFSLLISLLPIDVSTVLEFIGIE